MLRKKGLTKVFFAALMLAAAFPAIGFIESTAVDKPRWIAQGSMPTFDFGAMTAGWVDEFEHLAAGRASRDAAADAGENIVVVTKASPGAEVPLVAPMGESSEPKDVPKPKDVAVEADARLVTGSITSRHQPLLPPVPGPDAFRVQSESAKVLKGDRLGASQRIDLKPAQPAAPDAPADAGQPPPHADLAPVKLNLVTVPAVKSAMLLPTRSDRLKPAVVASASMKPMDLSPQQNPDAFFQGPPIPADPTIDPDAPVLGYADQMASAEAPFKSLFAVTPGARKSWLAVDNMPPKAKATKPAKLSHVVRRHGRKQGG
jgi:hypothetical protein